MWLAKLCTLVRAIIVLPLTAGNVIKSEDSVRHHDGRISSLVIGITVTAFVSVLIIVHDSIPDSILPLNIIKYFMIAMNVVSLLSIAILFKIGSQHIKNNTLLRRPFQDGAARLKVVFLWIFGLCVIVSNTLKIIMDYTCPGFRDNVETTHDILMILFFLAQQIFISCYHTYQYPHKMLVHYCMLTIGTYNLSVWFYDVIYKMINNSDNLKTSNNSVCEFEKLTRKIEPILFPALIEHCLIAVNFIAVIWNPNRKQNLKTNRQTMNDVPSVPTSSVERFGITLQRSLAFYISLAFGILVGVFMVFGFILLSMNKTNEAYYHGLILYKIVMKVVWTVLLYIAFYKLYIECNPKQESKQLSVGDFTLVASAFGLTIYHGFGLVAGKLTSAKSIYISGDCVFTENIFNIFVAYLQTVFILQSEHYVKKKDSPLSAFPIQTISILLFLFNAAFWVVDTFFETRFPWLSMVENQFYKRIYWLIITDTVFALGIFYRFHSATKLFALYTKFKI